MVKCKNCHTKIETHSVPILDEATLKRVIANAHPRQNNDALKEASDAFYRMESGTNLRTF